ncbi:MAG: hypothetical protein JST00_08240 [Deltaproteobacteria bacterium]|nr:hypothetical protein [Deltaproteobacteria bacterium]
MRARAHAWVIAFGLLASACGAGAAAGPEPLVPDTAPAPPSTSPLAATPSAMNGAPSATPRSFATKTLGTDAFALRRPETSRDVAPAGSPIPPRAPSFDPWAPTPLYGDVNPSPPSRSTPLFGDPNPSPPGR